jgi:hypothetical protein
MLILLSLLLTGCTTGLHGNYVPHTYIDNNANVKGELIGTVTGVSSQTWFLYLLPMGESPSTEKAITDAKTKIKGTKYLSDVSIDDRMIWGFGYSKQIIRVDAEARN